MVDCGRAVVGVFVGIIGGAGAGGKHNEQCNT